MEKKETPGRQITDSISAENNQTAERTASFSLQKKLQSGVSHSETKWDDGKCTFTSQMHVLHVTDLSGTFRGALPPPARGTAFELLLAVMLVSKPSTHLPNKYHGYQTLEKDAEFVHISVIKRNIWTHTANQNASEVVLLSC